MWVLEILRTWSNVGPFFVEKPFYQKFLMECKQNSSLGDTAQQAMERISMGCTRPLPSSPLPCLSVPRIFLFPLVHRVIITPFCLQQTVFCVLPHRGWKNKLCTREFAAHVFLPSV